jgi:PPM family protein phosphatase
MTLALHYALRSDVGLLRPGNEDSAYAGPRLLAIADGMGGHAAGEVASAVAISAIAPLDGQDLTDSDAMLDALADVVASARETLHEISLADPSVEGMGTTLTAMLWAGSKVAVCHIGDSRAYMLRDGDLWQITRDHTLVQSLVDEGRLSPAAAANHPQRSLIIRALQGSTDADPDLGIHEALLGDRYLLCSDGLTDVVGDKAVAHTLSTAADADQAVRQLIEMANENGGPDNITCIVADVVDDASGSVPPSRDPVFAGAAAGGDVRSLLRSTARTDLDALAPGAAGSTEDASVNGFHSASASRAADDDSDDEDDTGTGEGRRRWPVVTSILAVLVLVIAGGLYATWRYTQGQYYVGSDGSHVVIYRGIPQKIAFLSLSSVYKTTSVPTSHLPTGNLISLPTDPTSLAKAEATVGQINLLWTCGQDQIRWRHYQDLLRTYQKDLRQWQAKYGKKSTSKSGKKHKKATPKPPTAPPKPAAVPANCPAQGAAG